MGNKVQLVVDGVVYDLWAKDKTFASGSRGLTIGGKVEVNGEKCQFTGNVVVVGTNPNTANKKIERLEKQLAELREKNNRLPSGGTAEQIAAINARMTRELIDASNE